MPPRRRVGLTRPRPSTSASGDSLPVAPDDVPASALRSLEPQAGARRVALSAAVRPSSSAAAATSFCAGCARREDAARLRGPCSACQLQLSAEQAAAALAHARAVLVLAGPGSGKTRVIVARVCHLVRERGAQPSSIMAVTFTTKAAMEMRARINAELGGANVRALQVCTFHSACIRFLRAAGQGKFAVCDAAEQRKLAREALETVGSDPSQAALVLQHISCIKNGESAQQTDEFTSVLAAYTALLAKRNLVDFDDLLVRCVALLERDPAARRAGRAMARHLLVDEYQDTNGLQLRLLDALRRPVDDDDVQVHAHSSSSSSSGGGGGAESLFAVGDPDQSIYSWRYVNAESVGARAFRQRFRHLAPEVLRLRRNYRCTAHIAAAAAALMHAPGAVAAAAGDARCAPASAGAAASPQVLLVTHASEIAEALYLAERAREAVQTGGSVAILFRTNAARTPLAAALRSAAVPFDARDRGDAAAASPRERLAAVLRAAAEAREHGTDVHSVSPLLLRRGELPRRVRALIVAAASAASLRAVLAAVVAAAPRLRALLRGAAPLARTLSRALAAPPRSAVLGAGAVAAAASALDTARALDAPRGGSRAVLGARVSAAALEALADAAALTDDAHAADAPRVVLSTLHAAKGREFDVVFLAGCTDGVLPVRGASGTVLDEERRVLYVGMTRARRRLELSAPRPASRFLEELRARCPPSLLRCRDGPCDDDPRTTDHSWLARTESRDEAAAERSDTSSAESGAARAPPTTARSPARFQSARAVMQRQNVPPSAGKPRERKRVLAPPPEIAPGTAKRRQTELRSFFFRKT